MRCVWASVDGVLRMLSRSRWRVEAIGAEDARRSQECEAGARGTTGKSVSTPRAPKKLGPVSVKERQEYLARLGSDLKWGRPTEKTTR